MSPIITFPGHSASCIASVRIAHGGLSACVRPYGGVTTLEMQARTAHHGLTFITLCDKIILVSSTYCH